MYIWKTDALATELKQGTLSQRERFKCFFLIVFSFSGYDVLGKAGLLDTEIVPSSMWDIVIAISYNLIIVVALYFCYRINRAGDDQDFIARFICLIIPLSLRSMVIFFILFLMVVIPFIVVAKMGGENNIPDNYFVWVLGGLGISVTIWVCWRLLFWFRWISQENASGANRQENA